MRTYTIYAYVFSQCVDLNASDGSLLFAAGTYWYAGETSTDLATRSHNKYTSTMSRFLAAHGTKNPMDLSAPIVLESNASRDREIYWHCKFAADHPDWLCLNTKSRVSTNSRAEALSLHRTHNCEYARNRRSSDPSYLEKQREYVRNRRASDPAYVERSREQDHRRASLKRQFSRETYHCDIKLARKLGLWDSEAFRNWYNSLSL